MYEMQVQNIYIFKMHLHQNTLPLLKFAFLVNVFIML